MEKLGQIAMRDLSEREIILLTYQQLQSMDESFKENKKANDLQLHEVDKRLDAIEKKLQENDIIKSQSDTRYAKLIKWIALGFTVVQIIANIIMYLLKK